MVTLCQCADPTCSLSLLLNLQAISSKQVAMQEAFIILTWGLGASINDARKNLLKKFALIDGLRRLVGLYVIKSVMPT